jgi:hypothetical protein
MGNYNMEPPGLFRGRGEHPRTGALKKVMIRQIRKKIIRKTNLYCDTYSVAFLSLWISTFRLILAFPRAPSLVMPGSQ